MATFECWECEDQEDWPIEYRDRILRCECGGEMELVLTDHFQESKNRCKRCDNAHSDLCQVCKWHGQDA